MFGKHFGGCGRPPNSVGYGLRDPADATAPPETNFNAYFSVLTSPIPEADAYFRALREELESALVEGVILVERQDVLDSVKPTPRSSLPRVSREVLSRLPWSQSPEEPPMRRFPILLLMVLAACPQAGDAQEGAKSPADSLKCIQVRPGFTVELMAAEPLVRALSRSPGDRTANSGSSKWATTPSASTARASPAAASSSSKKPNPAMAPMTRRPSSSTASASPPASLPTARAC